MTEPQRPGPARPGIVRPSAPVAATAGYATAGTITSEQAINGDANTFAWLDEKILEVMAFVQQSMVAANRADDIDKARRSPELRAAMAQEIDRLALQYLMQQRSITGEQRAVLIASVVNEILGLGPLEPLWTDPAITEVIANGPNDIYVERNGTLQRAKGIRFRDQDHLLEVCQRILGPLNRKVDVRDPLADGRLPDGSRVNIVHTSLAPRGPLLTIRRFPESTRSMIDLVDIGSMDEGMATLLATYVAARASLLVVGGTGSGKALDVDTPIPTPEGFTRMGDLQVGDVVFDEKGQATTVVGAYDVQHDRPCYEVVFSDGSTIVADEEHLWLTYDRSARRSCSRAKGTPRSRRYAVSPSEQKVLQGALAGLPSDASVTTRQPSELLGWAEDGRHGRWPRPWRDQRHLTHAPRVRTTKEIAETVRVGEHVNHSIPLVSGPVQYPESQLPLHPRLLGLWLGDGASASARFSIPVSYMTSSIQQRKALLSGLLDTDGGVGTSGSVEFNSPNERLARQVFSLVASLGYHPTLREKESRLNGRSHGPTWTVAFLGDGTEFGLTRKARTVRARRPESRQGDRASHRYIVDVRPVASRPVRCIRVANESHLFLAGESYIPTHNTTLLNALSVAIPKHERLVTIEDSLELRLHSGAHVAAMEARPPDSSGKNAVTIRQLVKNALRMRPDRIIVGEIRDAAALDMLQACNTGHEGSMSTVHANGPNEAISRLSVMVAQGGEIPAHKVDWLVGSALDLIVMARRYEDGSRRVSGIYEVPDMATLGPEESLITIPLWEWEQTGVDEDGRLLGRYVQRNEPSERLSRAKGLDLTESTTWDELRRMCGVVTADTPESSANQGGAGS